MTVILIMVNKLEDLFPAKSRPPHKPAQIGASKPKKKKRNNNNVSMGQSSKKPNELIRTFNEGKKGTKKQLKVTRTIVAHFNRVGWEGGLGRG